MYIKTTDITNTFIVSILKLIIILYAQRVKPHKMHTIGNSTRTKYLNCSTDQNICYEKPFRDFIFLIIFGTFLTLTVPALYILIPIITSEVTGHKRKVKVDDKCFLLRTKTKQKTKIEKRINRIIKNLV